MSEYDYSMYPGWCEIAADAEAREVLRLRAASETMTPRERFHAAMRFEEVDRLPTMIMGLWPETLERWRAEGMTSLAAEMVRFDAPLQSCWLYGRCQGPIPAFDEETLAETDRHRDTRNYLGQMQRAFRGATAIPAFLDYPIKGRADWESYKKRFDPSSAGRLPRAWEQLVEEQQRPRGVRSARAGGLGLLWLSPRNARRRTAVDAVP